MKRKLNIKTKQFNGIKTTCYSVHSILTATGNRKERQKNLNLKRLRSCPYCQTRKGPHSKEVPEDDRP